MTEELPAPRLCSRKYNVPHRIKNSSQALGIINLNVSRPGCTPVACIYSGSDHQTIAVERDFAGSYVDLFVF